MTWFSARTTARSHVPVPPDEMWRTLTDPAVLAALTPLVHSIEPDGDKWRWTLIGIDGLGVRAQPSFTEHMEFVDHREIVFTPAPPPGRAEHAAVDGVYHLEPAPGGCTVAIDLTVRVDLPLPRVARRSVEKIMASTMRTTGQRFAANLYEHLGLDPTDASVEEGDALR